MIGSLRGALLDRSALGEVLIEVHGVGYRVVVSPRTLSQLPFDGEIFLYIHHHIREDAQALYGFVGRDDRQTFEALISAHGVGPSLALAILGVHTPDNLRVAVATNDDAALCLVPGVGKKTAARLLIELKSKLDVPDLAPNLPGAATGGSSVTGEVREALVGLGYGQDEIREALRELPTSGSAAVLLRQALGLLGSKRA
jgi:holliday junction DNA helicase RuvA